MKTKPTESMPIQHAGFINQFVNAVYGILLGYGFSDAMREIKDGKPESVGPIFSSFAVSFIIIVVCMYWWDWFKNIGRRVESNVREFALDITILVSLESLFFVYERTIVFAFVIFILSILSLSWGVHYHAFMSKRTGYSKWRDYVTKNPNVKNYIRDRVLGVFLFGSCLILAILLSGFPELNTKVLSWLGNETWIELLQGNWVEFIAIVIAFSLNRMLFFKHRPGIEKDVEVANSIENGTA